MSSCVFVKFMSQKEPRRIEFDGTGISVFELKRDIIVKNGLDRSGTDFDLAIYNQDGSEEYDDDTSVITRSTTVLARRLPAMRPGAGRAARYISGKMPVQAKNHSRREQATKAATAKSQSDALAKMASAQTEEEKMMAMFAAQGEQWKSAQEEMSHQTPVFRPGQKKPANVPDHEPPNGYVCHRCGEKGHWIQQCPTNDNPEYNDRPRIKRTTGIPKSFLKTVDKATVLAQAADDDGSKPSGVMVTADGEFVVAQPDKKTWDQYKAKAKGSEEAKKAAAQDEQELRGRGLECELDKKMFIDPMKTPCCAKTYCNDCITNALIEGDLVCPSCQTEGVLIDDLKPDDEAVKRIDEYMKEKEAARKERSKTPEEAKSPAAADIKESVETADGSPEEKPKSPTPAPSIKSPSVDASQKLSTANNEASPAPTTGSEQPPINHKKRSAEEDIDNPIAKAPKGPKAMQRAQEQQQQQQQQQQMNMMPDFMGMNGMNGFNPMAMPMGMGMGMGMNPMMNMNPGMMSGFGNFGPMGMNPMMNPMMMNGGFNTGGMNGGFPTRPMNGGGPKGFGGPQMNGGMNGGVNGNFNRGPPTGPRNGNFAAQQNMNMAPNMVPNVNANGIEDDAYFRKPVNPHRHQNRQRRVRPSDYREL
ncbi:Protein mpe1 [Gnomoniopsis sp. IMI 355080]|nr:Protein mpe1 [Gnomoniopsis sp. IMI 355080]